MRRTGYTLIETVAALAVAALLIAAAGAPFLLTTAGLSLERGVWQVRSALNAARLRSVFRAEDVRVSFEDGFCVVERYLEDESAWRREETRPFEGVTVEANNRPVFHPTGTVSNLATIEVWNARGRYRITLAISGRVKATRIA